MYVQYFFVADYLTCVVPGICAAPGDLAPFNVFGHIFRERHPSLSELDYVCKTGLMGFPTCRAKPGSIQPEFMDNYIRTVWPRDSGRESRLRTTTTLRYRTTSFSYHWSYTIKPVQRLRLAPIKNHLHILCSVPHAHPPSSSVF